MLVHVVSYFQCQINSPFPKLYITTFSQNNLETINKCHKNTNIAILIRKRSNVAIQNSAVVFHMRYFGYYICLNELSYKQTSGHFKWN